MTQDTTGTTSTPYITLYYQPAFFCGFVPVHGQRPNLNPIIKFWISHPAESGYDPNKNGHCSVDLTRTPSRYNPWHFHCIQIDDHVHDDGCTTFGPNFPHAYPSGGVYLSGSSLKQITDNYIESRYKESNTDASVVRLSLSVDVVTSFIPVDETIKVQWPDQPKPKPEDNQLIRYRGFFGQQLDPQRCRNLWVVWHSGTWKDKVSNMPPGSLWRAPRKLWIPDNVIHDVGMSRADTGDVQSAYLYLEHDYAVYTANLDVPKQPSASGDRIISQIEQLLNSHISILNPPFRSGSQTSHDVATTPRPPSNLSVISDYAPGEVYRIKQQIEQGSTRPVIVQKGQTISEAVSVYAKNLQKQYLKTGQSMPTFDNLDLIGHSRSRDKILKIGEIALTSRTAKLEFSKLSEDGILELLGIQAIRLLGCRTAIPPRGPHVARTIFEHTGIEVYGARADLFAVHYDGFGFRREAEVLLADYDVLTDAGPGDIPPSDDYPSPLLDDDDDDDVEGDPIIPKVPPPASFSTEALSDPNAAVVSAANYQFWHCGPQAFPEMFEKLAAMLYADQPLRDNPLCRAEYEVLLTIAVEPRDIADVRSFDLFIKDPRPRLRVNRGGASYAFYFQKPQHLREDLACLGIHVSS